MLACTVGQQGRLFMTIQELTAQMHQMVTDKGWHAPDSPRPQTPRNIAISLSLETAEVLEHFQWGEAVRDRAALAGELADVALYLLQLASLCEIDLQQAILDKIAVNYGRRWDHVE
ncbi:MAG: nucleotide pyrophosphohydrolase [Anaerolineae bacterium]|nr:nucleotide pyrophosphohydrolase [Anaerolineae bacterium]